jgi:PilZ domain-containing protein
VGGAVIERRSERRLARERLSLSQVTLRPGCPVDVLDLSPQGVQVESVRPLRPGSRVLVRLAAGDQIVTVAAVVLRCSVSSVHPDDGLTYRGGLRFDELCLPFWEEQARGSNLTNAPP